MYKFNVKTIVELKSRSCTKNIGGGAGQEDLFT